MKARFKGHVKLWARDAGKPASKWELVGEIDNLIVDAAIDWIGYALVDEAAKYDTGITYCAIGTDSTAPDDEDTTLGSESARNPITTKSYTPATKTIALSTFFAAADCTINMKEVGLFGADATASTDTGEMINHALLNYDNSGGTKDLTIDIDITLAEGS